MEKLDLVEAFSSSNLQLRKTALEQLLSLLSLFSA